MKGITITDSEKKLLFIVLAIGILAASYFFGFVKFMDQTSVIEKSNEQDASLLAQLQNMVAKQAETVAETEKYKQQIQDVIAKYPVKLPQEKAIYLLQLSEDMVNVDYSSITFAMDNTLMNFTGQDVNPVGKFASISVPYTGTYEDVKALLEYVAQQEDRTTIPIITMNYDNETGGLMGAITYRMYYLTNTGKEYEEFPETGIPMGVVDIFHSEDGVEIYESIEQIQERLQNRENNTDDQTE